ncbi:aminotransferase class I/II-fold pyridoxal phosphate-dependent enzyme [Geofilum rhodophaeum]|uniref:aminotransferase class I/II-fold pyridoxal phosphate-dependent enzyme n=1 Tax=Geofilum rhodophaeum TaxID=1965019 RepID=UPI000B520368|nr:aminotransferase class I/II-fold pyridoxal phosphate-dependent enzyme [Geofilum rhodophaeum]
MDKQNKRIYLACPHMGGQELPYICEAFAQNWIAPVGPNIEKFEQVLANYLGVKHVAALSSGSAALHLGLLLCGVQAGDEVLTATMTFAATVNPIVYLGATPVLIDSEPGTWNMDPVLLEEAILDRLVKGKLPKAIVPVHIYGMPANMEAIMAVADRYQIPVVEDATEALGSRYKGRAVGSFGRVAAFSFNGNKIITTSGGGALASDDGELIAKARFYATQARDHAPHYQHSCIGYNYRLSNVLAGIGLGQMEVLEQRVAQKRALHDFYLARFGGVPGLQFLSEPAGDYFSNYWLTTVLIDPLVCGFGREDLRLYLESDNVESRPAWKPMHLQPVFKDCPAYINGTAEHIFDFGLCLPSATNMDADDLERVGALLSHCFTTHHAGASV